MPRPSHYDALEKEIRRQLADGRELRDVNVTAAARAIGCTRPAASALYHWGLAGHNGKPGRPAIKTLFQNFAPPPHAEQADESRSTMTRTVSRASDYTNGLVEDLGPVVARARETLRNTRDLPSDLPAVFDALDRIAKVSASLASTAEKLGSPTKKRPVPPPFEPLAPPQASQAEIEARLAQRAAELGEEDPDETPESPAP